jgi:AraC-like DNA-binding protein
MRAAQELLSRGLGVSTVSRELGYASDEGFSRAFRRSVGTTPSAWRSTHQPVSA